MKAFIKLASVLNKAFRTTTDDCHRALKLTPIADADLKAACDENHNRTPQSISDLILSMFRLADDKCSYELCVDLSALQGAVIDSLPCSTIQALQCAKVEEYDITDGKTQIVTTVPFDAYTAGNGKFDLSLNGKTLSEKTKPTSVTTSDAGGFVAFDFNEPVGAVDNPCNVKADLTWASEINVVTCSPQSQTEEKSK